MRSRSLQTQAADDAEDGDGAGEVKPDVIQLTDEELNQDFSRNVNATDKKAPNKIFRFNFKDGVYKDESTLIDYSTVHFAIDGCVV